MSIIFLNAWSHMHAFLNENRQISYSLKDYEGKKPLLKPNISDLISLKKKQCKHFLFPIPHSSVSFWNKLWFSLICTRRRILFRNLYSPAPWTLWWATLEYNDKSNYKFLDNSKKSFQLLSSNTNKFVKNVFNKCDLQVNVVYKGEWVGQRKLWVRYGEKDSEFSS